MNDELRSLEIRDSREKTPAPSSSKPRGRVGLRQIGDSPRTVPKKRYCGKVKIGTIIRPARGKRDACWVPLREGIIDVRPRGLYPPRGQRAFSHSVGPGERHFSAVLLRDRCRRPATSSSKLSISCYMVSITSEKNAECSTTRQNSRAERPRGVSCVLSHHVSARLASFLETKTPDVARKAQVAELVAQGSANKVIAQYLGLREGTVKIHVHNIYQKLGVPNRTSLILSSNAKRAQYR